MAGHAAEKGGTRAPLRLYHGSDVAIDRPDVALNSGFADLGRGFYLTDDHDAARGRAISRARHTGAAEGVVSVFELDEGCVPWVIWGSEGIVACGQEPGPGGRFGLRFEGSAEGLAAWATYIRSCRSGHTEVAGYGSPAIVRAWIATEEVEMVCSGFVPADAIAEIVDPEDLVVQYCLVDQALVDGSLTFVGSEVIPR